MKVGKYHLTSDETLSVFEFISVGPKGAIRKIIDFQPTDIPGLYNLAFGDKHPVTGEIDDLAVTNNGDTDKILATVVAALYTFLGNVINRLVGLSSSCELSCFEIIPFNVHADNIIINLFLL